MRMKSSTTNSWIHGYDWQEECRLIAETGSLLREKTGPLVALAEEIVEKYTSLDSSMEILSQRSCPRCTDVCCLRATVWFDRKDLLVIYYSQGEVPPMQVFRLEDGTCCHLTVEGCSLARSERPFICTWYICPAMKKAMDGSGRIPGLLGEIKELRRTLWEGHRRLVGSMERTGKGEQSSSEK